MGRVRGAGGTAAAAGTQPERRGPDVWALLAALGGSLLFGSGVHTLLTYLDAEDDAPRTPTAAEIDAAGTWLALSWPRAFLDLAFGLAVAAVAVLPRVKGARAERAPEAESSGVHV